ncbi:MAG TPA: hypothetical protein VK760_06130 [Candidatus Acidoferrales bacterium]|jgi:hypothetical protein|nr:hypothetical protein [Candidatus Acidoferrales bacterium]
MQPAIKRAIATIAAGALLAGCSHSTTSFVPTTTAGSDRQSSDSALDAGLSGDATFVDEEAGPEDAASDDADARPNAIKNGHFETGRLAPWKNCGTLRAIVTKEVHYKSGFSAELGDRRKDRTGKKSAICQKVTIAKDSVLSFFWMEKTDQRKMSESSWVVGLRDLKGNVVFQTKPTLKHDKRWKKRTVRFGSLAGRYELFFRVRSIRAGQPDAFDHLYLDGIAVRAGAQPSPSPSSSPVARLNPPAVTLPNVAGVTVGPITVSGIAPGVPVSISSNSCAGNVTPTVSGQSVTLSVTKLFNANPADGCTIGVSAAGTSLPLAVSIPLIAFAKKTLPAGSTLTGNVLNLANDVTSNLADPVLSVTEPDVNGAFTVANDSCKSGNDELQNLLKPVIDASSDLKLRFDTTILKQLTGGAVCHVVVEDDRGRGNTLTVNIPAAP